MSLRFNRRRGRLARARKRDKNLKIMRKRAEKAASRIEPYAASARDWAAPRLEHATETVQDTIAPKVTATIGTAAERLEPARDEAKRRGAAAARALKGEKVKARRRWPAALLFFGVGTAVGAVLAALARKPEVIQEARAQLSSTPRPPRPATSPDDEAQGTRRDEHTPVDGQSRG